MPAALPAQFGPYLVLQEIGCGGMGAVYRALDPRLEREVAVKVLHRNLEVSGARERFLREARLVSSLNHPNICTVFDIGEQDGDPFLVMELLHGESLKERVERGAMPELDLREVAFRVGLALQAAHAKGVVHRDIKPANIFLASDGAGSTDVKVLDFGLAMLEREAGQQRVSTLTRVGATVGTVEYMSPEQACGEVLDARTDLFSLGAVLYEMATGQVPFRGATSAVVFSELLNHDPVPPREANLRLSAEMDRTIRSLLVKRREGRMSSATELLKALTDPGDELGTLPEWVPAVTQPRDASRDRVAFGLRPPRAAVLGNVATAESSLAVAVPGWSAELAVAGDRLARHAAQPLLEYSSVFSGAEAVPEQGPRAAAARDRNGARRRGGASRNTPLKAHEIPADPLPAYARPGPGTVRKGIRSYVFVEEDEEVAPEPVRQPMEHTALRWRMWAGMVLLLTIAAASMWLMLRSHAG